MIAVTTMVSRAMKNSWSLEIELYRARAQPTRMGAEQRKRERMPSMAKGTNLETEERTRDSSGRERNLLWMSL